MNRGQRGIRGIGERILCYHTIRPRKAVTPESLASLSKLTIITLVAVLARWYGAP